MPPLMRLWGFDKMVIRTKTKVGALTGLALIASGAFGLAATHDTRMAERERVAIERQIEADALAAEIARAEQAARDAEAASAAQQRAEEARLAAEQEAAAELEARAFVVSRENFRSIPLGATESQIRTFIQVVPDTETADVVDGDEKFDLWLHWVGPGRSQINVFIVDDVVIGANYWADAADGVVSFAQFAELENRLNPSALSFVDLSRLLLGNSTGSVSDYLGFQPTRERRIFDAGDVVTYFDYPGWGSRLVTLGFLNDRLMDVAADVAEPGDMVLGRVG
jgi:hypothetical protein